MVQRRLIPEDGAGLAIQRLDEAHVGRAEVLRRPREVRGAAQQTEMKLVPVLRDRRQIDPAAMSGPRLGGLRQRLERVLRADPSEVVIVRPEEPAVVHADAVDPNGHPPDVDERPRQFRLLIPV